MFIAGGKYCLKYPRTVEDCMKECRLAYHRAVNYSIVEHEFLTNEEVRERLTCLKIFPVGKERPPVARYNIQVFVRLSICNMEGTGIFTLACYISVCIWLYLY
jgi:hypothetical protein